MRTLRDRGILRMATANNKKIHFLGMVDGPNEILLCKGLKIDTWDSSAAVWAGLNDIEFDTSPTGMVNGKFEDEVDFDYICHNKPLIDKALNNIRYIDTLSRMNH